jgi:hypothetical protein
MESRIACAGCHGVTYRLRRVPWSHVSPEPIDAALDLVLLHAPLPSQPPLPALLPPSPPSSPSLSAPSAPAAPLPSPPSSPPWPAAGPRLLVRLSRCGGDAEEAARDDSDAEDAAAAALLATMGRTVGQGDGSDTGDCGGRGWVQIWLAAVEGLAPGGSGAGAGAGGAELVCEAAVDSEWRGCGAVRGDGCVVSPGGGGGGPELVGATLVMAVGPGDGFLSVRVQDAAAARAQRVAEAAVGAGRLSLEDLPPGRLRARSIRLDSLGRGPVAAAAAAQLRVTVMEGRGLGCEGRGPGVYAVVELGAWRARTAETAGDEDAAVWDEGMDVHVRDWGDVLRVSLFDAAPRHAPCARRRFDAPPLPGCSSAPLWLQAGA